MKSSIPSPGASGQPENGTIILAQVLRNALRVAGPVPRNFHTPLLLKNEEQNHKLLTVGFDGAKPKFLVWENNDFTDKTDEVMPPTSWAKVEGSHEYYRLPQIGRVVDHVRHFIDSAAQPMEQITKEQLEFDSSLGKFVIKG